MFGLQVSVVKDLLRFAQVFSQMIHIGIELPIVQVSEQFVRHNYACMLQLIRVVLISKLHPFVAV